MGRDCELSLFPSSPGVCPIRKNQWPLHAFAEIHSVLQYANTVSSLFHQKRRQKEKYSSLSILNRVYAPYNPLLLVGMLVFVYRMPPAMLRLNFAYNKHVAEEVGPSGLPVVGVEGTS